MLSIFHYLYFIIILHFILHIIFLDDAYNGKFTFFVSGFSKFHCLGINFFIFFFNFNMSSAMNSLELEISKVCNNPFACLIYDRISFILNLKHSILYLSQFIYPYIYRVKYIYTVFRKSFLK